ncbi:hypothetical protein DSECCO2_403840 [anaerobic digester metagenome]
MKPECLQHEDSGQEGEVEKGQGLPCDRYVIPGKAEADYADEGNLEGLEYPEKRFVIPVVHPERVRQVHVCGTSGKSLIGLVSGRCIFLLYGVWQARMPCTYYRVCLLNPSYGR